MISPEELLHNPSRFTVNVAERCVFMDFESLKDGDPLLGGILKAGQFEQCILDARLNDAADAKSLGVQSLRHGTQRSTPHWCHPPPGSVLFHVVKGLFQGQVPWQRLQ